MNRLYSNPQPSISRRGSVLVIVLVVVILLALAAYNYSQLMLTEMEAASIHVADVQARALCDSGAEYIATLLANRSLDSTLNLQSSPQLFQGLLVVDSGHVRGRGRFSIIAPVEQDAAAGTVRYGLMDESAKINLNTLPRLFKTEDAEEQTRTLLMGLPNMTEEIADSILDWIDVDDNTRQYGAEADYYTSMSLPYTCKNAPLETIDELLLVRGVTAELLYGEDANRNGLLDANENDGQATPPLDNADGVLQHGWIAYFTVHSREMNLRSDGTAKININSGLLTDVYDQVLEEFGEEAANFIIQYRLAGPVEDPFPAETDDSGTSGSSSGGNSSSKSSGSSSSGSRPSSYAGWSNSSLQSGSGSNTAQAAQALGNLAGQALASGLGPVTRGPYDLSKGGQTRIVSLWELFDSQANKAPKAQSEGGGQTDVLDSPFSSSDTELVAQVLDALSLSDDPFIEGRINLNQARAEILAGLPYMTTELVDAIVNAQQVANDPTSSAAANRSDIGWLFREGLTDIQTVRALDQYLTTRGDVYRAQILGFFDGGGPVARTEVVVDGTQVPPRIVFYRDLNDLGRGYSRAQLLTPAAQ